MSSIQIASKEAYRVNTSSLDISPRKRADWRFLLPQPNGQRFENFLLLGAPECSGRSLIEAGLADHFTYAIPSDTAVDAAAILEGARVRAEQVAGCLRAGAPIYYEWVRPPLAFRSSIAGIRSRLNAHGLSLTGIYWVLPGFREAKRYISLDLPDAVEWYLNTFYIAPSPLHRLLESSLRLFVRRHSERLIPFARSLALTAVKQPGKSSEIEVMKSIPEIRGKVTHSILLTSGQDASSRLVILPFAQSGSDPSRQ